MTIKSSLNKKFPINVGDIYTNKEGYKIKVIEYVKSRKILIEFQDKFKYKCYTRVERIYKGEIHNPYHPKYFNKAYIGEKPLTSDKRGIKHRAFILWIDMIGRCFNPQQLIDRPSYKGVTCCKEWLNYSNFCEWYLSQSNIKYIEAHPEEKWSIDKDIIDPTNKTYCPEKCCIVPMSINSLFQPNHTNSNTGLRGVKRYTKPNGTVFYGSLGKYFKSMSMANEYYKNERTKSITTLANKAYKENRITKSCRDGMINWYRRI